MQIAYPMPPVHLRRSGDSASLRRRLAPAEIFHEIMEHRWYLSEEAGCDVGTTTAARWYFETVLPRYPAPSRGCERALVDGLLNLTGR